MPAKGGEFLMSQESSRSVGDDIPRRDVLVVGGGLIGLAIAWQASKRGLSVAVVDPEPGAGASTVAAGMLAPVSELVPVDDPIEQALLRFNLSAAAAYPAFVEELAADSDISPAYRRCGTLVVALDRDDRAALGDLHDFQRSLGLPSEWLSGAECRRLEPLLAPDVRAGLLAAGDHQVDNRKLHAALCDALDRIGVPLCRRRVEGLVVEHDAARGVVLDNGAIAEADQIVAATGCWGARLPWLPPGLLPTIRPVKGQILRLTVPRAFRPLLSRTVRGLVRGSHAYLVPRESGELVLGATSEDIGDDTSVTAGGVYELLRDAHAILPAVSELPLVETLAGLRPAAPDNAPVIGQTALPGLIAATGHYRNGVLLTPATASAVAELLAAGRAPEAIEPFTPLRFARSRTSESQEMGR
jgi:glycine oxidase